MVKEHVELKPSTTGEVYEVVYPPRGAPRIRGSQPVNRMKAARIRHGCTQQQMAERLGITQATYSRIENGRVDEPEDKEILGKIAEMLGIDKAELFKTEHVSGKRRELSLKEATSIDSKSDQEAMRSDEIPHLIRDLYELCKDNIITREQFLQKRDELLKRI